MKSSAEMKISMKLKKSLAVILSVLMALSCMVFPPQLFVLAAGDYGIVTTNSDKSITFSFGEDSITQSGGGTLIEDTVNGGL